jgi:hypothetical protein
MLGKPEKKSNSGDQPNDGDRSHPVFELQLGQSSSLGQEVAKCNGEEQKRPNGEFNDRSYQLHQCGVHACPLGKKPESYREAFLAVIGDPFFIGPVAFLAGLLIGMVWIVQAVSSAA